MSDGLTRLGRGHLIPVLIILLDMHFKVDSGAMQIKHTFAMLILGLNILNL